MPLDYRLAALIGEEFTRKNAPFSVGTPVRIEYAYPASRPGDWPEAGFQLLETASHYRSLVEEALALVEVTCGVDFVQVADAEARVAFGISPLAASGTAGYALTFYRDMLAGYASYVVYDQGLLSAANTRQAILHEIGHALGLKHPGPYEADDKGPFLPADEDSTHNTIMSYHFDTDDVLAFAPYDVLALQYLYGPPISAGVRVGIVDGNQIRVGSAGDELFALDSFAWWSAHDTATFFSYGGVYRASDDGLTIDGKGGTDEVYIPLARNQVQLTRAADGTLELVTEWDVELTNGAIGKLTLTDHLRDIERLRFTNGTLALDTGRDQPAGQAYALLYAALDGPPPADLLGLCLALFDAGRSAGQVADQLIAAYAPKITSTSLVDLLYRNLIGAAPSVETMTSLSALIDSGAYSRGDFWAAAAALDLNYVQFAGLIDEGYLYG